MTAQAHKKKRFRMDTLSSIAVSIQRGNFLASMSLYEKLIKGSYDLHAMGGIFSAKLFHSV